MNVISIQSHVAYGHVGNAVAVFALQRLGIEVWPVHSVQFSNHTGYPAWQGEIFSADHIARLLDGLAARGALARCDALLTGYIGDAALGAVILDAAKRLRAANPRARRQAISRCAKSWHTPRRSCNTSLSGVPTEVARES